MSRRRVDDSQPQPHRLPEREPGETRERVKYIYHRIVCSYPRYPKDAPYNEPGIGSIRIPRDPEYSYLSRGVWYTKSQATEDYGRKTARLCNNYGVEVLTGWWDFHDNRPWESFNSSFKNITSADLVNLRLAYMFGVIKYRPPGKAPYGFPDTENAIRMKVSEWAIDMKNRERYAHITDANGNRRPLLFAWGFIENQNDARVFQRLIMSRSNTAGGKGVRQIIEEQTGATPFIIISQHNALGARFDEITTSVDAFYEHDIAIPDKRTAPQKYHIITTQQSLDGIRDGNYTLTGTRDLILQSIRNISGKRNASTGLPVSFVSGGMPQFNSDLVPNNTHAVVRATSKAEVQRMFEMYRQFAPTISVEEVDQRSSIEHKWVAISTLAEWAEGTTIEPTRVREGGFGELYNNFSDYGYDFMELVWNVFKPTGWFLR